MLKESKQFILRGNVVDVAVGIVIGLAFGAVVAALVADLISPLIAAVLGKPDLSHLTFTFHKSTFPYGAFINAVLTFFFIAGAVFVAVRPMTTLITRHQSAPRLDPTTRG